MTTINMRKRRHKRDFFAATFFATVLALSALAMTLSGCTNPASKPHGGTVGATNSPETLPGEDVIEADGTDVNEALGLNRPLRIGVEGSPRSFETTTSNVRRLQILLMALKGQWTERDLTPTEEAMESRRSACIPDAKWNALYQASEFKNLVLTPLGEQGVQTSRPYYEFGKRLNPGSIADLLGTGGMGGIIGTLDDENDIVTPIPEERHQTMPRMADIPRVWGNVHDMPVLIRGFFLEGLRVFTNANCAVGGSGTPDGAKFELPTGGNPPRIVMQINNVKLINEEDGVHAEAAFHVINGVSTGDGITPRVSGFHVRHYVVHVNTGLLENKLDSATSAPDSSNLSIILMHSDFAPTLADYVTTQSPIPFPGLIPSDSRLGFKRRFDKTTEARAL